MPLPVGLISIPLLVCLIPIRLSMSDSHAALSMSDSHTSLSRHVCDHCRLLVGGKLQIHLGVPEVTVTIIK